MKAKNYAIAYWLLPEPAAHALFSKKIRELARRFGAPEFAPHVTVFIAPENSRRPVDILRDLGAVSVELTIRGIQFSEQFTKTLFVQFERNDPIQRVADRIWKASRAPKQYVIDPHLSLLYANVSLQTKESLARDIAFPLHKVRLTSVCAVRCARPTTTMAEVRQWQLVAP